MEREVSDKLADLIDKKLDGDCGYGVGQYLADAIREHMLIPVAPLGIPLDRDAIREAWEEFVVRLQDGRLQSVEDRILMAALRSLYNILPPTEQEPEGGNDE
jgi:hypothetical protein